MEAPARDSNCAAKADVDSDSTFVIQSEEHLGAGCGVAGGQPTVQPVPSESDLDRLRREAAASGALPRRGRPTPAVVAVAQRVLGPHAHLGGFHVAAGGCVLAPGELTSTVSVGRAGNDAGLPASDTVRLQRQGLGGCIEQDAPTLIPPALRRALNEQEVAAQAAARAARRGVAARHRTRTLTHLRHPRGLLSPSASAPALGATRDMASRLAHDAAGGPPSMAESTTPVQQPPTRTHTASAARCRRSRGEQVRPFDILRPTTATPGAAPPSGREAATPPLRAWDPETQAGVVAGARLQPGNPAPVLAAQEGQPAAGAGSRHGRQLAGEGDELAALPRRRRVPEWRCPADLELGSTTHGRIFAQPAAKSPSTHRRQALLDAATRGRRYDVVTGAPLPVERRPTKQSMDRASGPTHPSQYSTGGWR